MRVLKLLVKNNKLLTRNWSFRYL